MKAYLMTFLIVSIQSTILMGQGSRPSNGGLFDSYIKKLIEQDLYYYLDFEKDEIPKATIFYFEENIQIDLERFLLTRDTDIQFDTISKVDLTSFSFSKKKSNYVAFNSGIVDGYIMFEVFFNREEYLNVPGKNKYETWKSHNGGMSYLFSLNDQGFILGFEKKPINYN